MISDLRSPQAAAQSINQVFADPEKFSRMKEGAELAGRELNWDVEGRKLMDIYASL
ncbi:hypothetical protein GO496_16795 [Acidovorax citrulli]|nr:hypothetical protein [Paracidovorax citrulli]